MNLPATLTPTLTPVQRAMLFHHLVAPRSGVDIEQLVSSTGPVDARLLAVAWQRLVAQHPILRCYPAQGDDGEYRLQLAEQAAPPFEVHHDASLADWLAADRARGFELLRAPPLRLALLQHAGQVQVVLTVHHVLLDAGSFPPILVDLWDAYDALAAGCEPGFPARGEDGARIRALSRPDPGAALAYWRELLGEVRAPTPFPELAAGAAPAWQWLEHRIEDEHAAAIHRGAHAQGVGLHILIQAAWATALARRVDADSVLFGAVRAGRGPTASGAPEVLGCLISTVPVLGRVGERSGSELLADLAAQHDAAYAHEHVSLAAVHAAVLSVGAESLFHSLVVHDRDDLDTAVHRVRPDWTDRRFVLHERTGYPVTLYACGEDRIRLALAYDATLLQPTDAQRLLRRVGWIAAGIARTPSAALRTLDVLLPEERELLARAGCGPVVAVDAATVVEQFERCAIEHPDRTAVVAGSQRLRYDEFADRVDALAGRLAAAGAGAGTIVGLNLDRSLELPIAMLAVLRAGAAYLPLDPDYPAERIDYYLSDSDAAMILTQRRHAQRFAGRGVKVLCVDDPCESQPPRASIKRPAPPDLAYLIYTSGSTGEPKGVEVTHANVANFFAGMDLRIRSEGERRWLAVASPSFDVSVLELLWTLCRGFELVVHGARADAVESGGAAADADHDVVRDIAAHRITHLQFTPSLARMVPMFAHSGTELASLRELLVGGEALPPDLARDLYARLHPDARILNVYGPTETTVWATVAEVPRGADRVPIGTPIANVACHVVDSRRQPVPPGQAGELLISGAGVTRGYHRRAQLTASRFVLIPFGAGHTRAYATGDLVRHEPDGSLGFLGRTDFQIKVRGHRIEPGEIEVRLRQMPGVGDAVVVAREDSVGTLQLVAYVAPLPGATLPDPAQLRERLRHVMPEHLVPDTCVVLDALPMTLNGKVDRLALPEPRATRSEAAGAQALNDDAERKVHDIWCAVLGLASVGRDDNFFELGGHSILAVKAQDELARTFGQRLPIVELFRAPTLAALAARLTAGAPPTTGAAQHGAERALQRRAALRRRAGTAEDSHE